MTDDPLLRAQRDLRSRLFEGPGALRWRPGRELAAEMLLYLDDPQACWQLACEWLLDLLDADRVDGGYGGFVGPGGRAQAYEAATETMRSSRPSPSVRGLRFDGADWSLRALWQRGELCAIPSVAHDASLSEPMRHKLASVGTVAKLALPLRSGAMPVGFICADWADEAPTWHAETCRKLGELARMALGPLLEAAAAHVPRDDPADPGAALALARLTLAEQRLARLIAHGVSYKEAARQLDRSISTVDHQLRSIREKLGVPSTARLVRLLNEPASPAH